MWTCFSIKKIFEKTHKIQPWRKYDSKGNETTINICTAELTGKWNLNNHIASVHEGKKVNNLCSLCGGTFSQLRQHISIVHERKRPFACHICGLRCIRESILKYHIDSVHEQKKPIKCEICCKGFASIHQLRKHQDSHENIRPHKCQICDAKFKRKYHLKNHMKTIHSCDN